MEGCKKQVVGNVRGRKGKESVEMERQRKATKIRGGNELVSICGKLT